MKTTSYELVFGQPPTKVFFPAAHGIGIEDNVKDLLDDDINSEMTNMPSTPSKTNSPPATTKSLPVPDETPLPAMTSIPPVSDDMHPPPPPAMTNTTPVTDEMHPPAMTTTLPVSDEMHPPPPLATTNTMTDSPDANSLSAFSKSEPSSDTRKTFED